MVGRDYLDAARYLMAAPSEINRRMAAGPLYCAALNEARDALERWGFVPPAGADTYDYVFARFYQAPDMALIRIGDILRRAREYRDLADDSRSSPAKFADDRELIGLRGLVEFALDLDQIEADPARRAKAIADVQTTVP